VGVFYSILVIPAMVAVAVAPLHPGRGVWTVAMVPLVAAPLYFHSADLGRIDEQARMMLGASVLWFAIAVQLIMGSGKWSKRARFWLIVAVLAGAVQAWFWTFRPPYLGKSPLPPAGHPDAVAPPMKREPAPAHQR
jgi:hypothetical protein